MTHQDLFNLTQIPERPSKPRQTGLTMVMDKGLSLSESNSLCENGEHTIDLVKLGFGTSYLTPKLKEKIALYKQHHFQVYLGGTLFEAYYIRNQLDDFLRLNDKLGLHTIEVSDGSLSIPHSKKCEVIAALSKNFTVLSEVGSKDAEKVIPPYEWIDLMQKELAAGAWKVIAEARESGTVGMYRNNGEVRTGLIAEIIRQIEAHQILWETPQKNQQVFFIKLLGANANLGNISPQEILALEALRLGLRGDSFDFFITPNNNIQ
jgi:phosphosulfolactate synthase